MVERNAEVAPDNASNFVSASISATVSRRATATLWATVSISPRASKGSRCPGRSACLTTPIGRSDRGSTPRSAISARSSSRTHSRAGARLFARGRPAGLRSCRLPSRRCRATLWFGSTLGGPASNPYRGRNSPGARTAWRRSNWPWQLPPRPGRLSGSPATAD